MGALHNICFYQGSDDIKNQNTIWKFSGDISIVLCDILKNKGDIDFLKVEAVRVLGNMTLNKKARETFSSNDGIKLMITFLNDPCYDLRMNSAGVLVNILGDYDKRAIFEELKGPEILKDVLFNALDQHDIVFATIICQCIWNFLLENSTVNKIDEHFSKDIYDLLLYHIDEETDSNWSSNVWLEFINVAADLIDKFQFIVDI